MAVKIRLARAGAKKRPFYRIVVADSRSPRDGRFIEKLGTYNPLLPKEDEQRISLNKERIEYWLGQGATPSDRVESFLVTAEILKKNPKKEFLIKKAIERQKIAAEKKAKEEAENNS